MCAACLLPVISVPWKRKRCSDEDRERKVGSAVYQNGHGHGREDERGGRRDGDEDEDEEE